MQNDMVSIPSANMNGGLKAANSSGTVVGVGVAGTVLTNAQRVYLTPASSYHLAAAARQTGGGATATVVSGGGSNVGSGVGGVQPTTAIASTSSAAHGTVRYFSQFSKLQPVQQLNAASVGQHKLLNGDTMVLVNGGSKPLIFATTNNNNNNNSKLRTTTTTTATAFASATTVPNGNRVFINMQQLQQKQFQLQQQQQRKQLQQQQLQQQQSATVIDEQDVVEEVEEEEDVEHVVEEDEEDEQPLALLTGTTATTTPAEERATTITTTTKWNNNDPDAEPELDIVINNVVCSFSVRCHLKLREIALNGANVEYRRENGMVTMKLRRPYTTASIWSSGRITCTGATSESQVRDKKRERLKFNSSMLTAGTAMV